MSSKMKEEEEEEKKNKEKWMSEQTAIISLYSITDYYLKSLTLVKFNVSPG